MINSKCGLGMVGLFGLVYNFCENRILKMSPERAASRARRLYSLGNRVKNFRLRTAIQHAYESSPFYHRVFDEAGLKPSDVRTFEDLPKIPFTMPHDLASDPYQFLAVPKDQIFEVHTSAGTTGKPKKVFLTRRETEAGTFFAAVGYRMWGVRSKDVVQVMFSIGGEWFTGLTTVQAFKKLGLLVIPAGTFPTPEEQIRSMQEYGVTVVTGTPSYLHMLTDEGGKYAELRKLGVRMVFLSGEPWSESLRKRLMDAWDCPLIYDGYGLTEVGVVAHECDRFNGLHLNEAYVYTEVVDPKTGEVIEEEEGELVFTPLDREATPLLRYRSGDLSRLILDPCECGRLTHRIARVKGRSDEMLTLGTAENVSPALLESILSEIPGVREYQLVVTKEGHKDLLTFRLEAQGPKEKVSNLLRDSLLKRSTFRQDIQITRTIADPVVEILPPGALRKDKIKAKRIVDLREK